MCAGGATYVGEWYADTDEVTGDIADYMILLGDIFCKVLYKEKVLKRFFVE